MAEAKQLEDIIKRTLARSKAPETEVHVGGGRYALTRFANNTIHQNVEEANLEVSVRVQLEDGRSARASTNRTDDLGLTRVVENARAAAEISRPDPKAMPLYVPEGEPRTTSAAVDAETDAFTAQARAKAVLDVIIAAKRAGLTAAGQLTTARGSIGGYGESGTLAIGNSKGLFRAFDKTQADFSLTVMGESSSGWSAAFSPRIADLDLPALAQRAVEKAVASANPKGVEPGEWTVILEPGPVAALVWFLTWGLSAKGFHEGGAWTSGRLGQAVTGERFTLRSDPFDPRNPGLPFGGEGVPTRAMTHIDAGKLSALAWDRRTARDHGGAPTGHGARLPSSWGGSPDQVIVGGGETSIDEMIRGTKRGILVTRLWYNRLVEPRDVVVTGMTRDGTFLIEDGELVSGVKNLRYNVSVLDIFKRIAAMSPVAPVDNMLAPAMKIDGFRFTSATRF